MYERGFIRYVTAGNEEIIRMIYFALRDAQWRTIDLNISNETIEYSEGKSLRIGYQATSTSDGKVIINWDVRITCDDTGVLSFSVNGVVVNSFVRNRVGICVLHPIDGTIGNEVTIDHPDGTRSQQHFPVFIKPHQPFLEIRRMDWRSPGGIGIQLSFAGDIFETEDQRNWSDMSFKTYSTPLRIPFPVEIKPGERIAQEVKLRVSDFASAGVVSQDESAVVTVDHQRKHPFPALGTTLATGSEEPTSAARQLLAQLQPDHLRVDLNLYEHSWRDTLHHGLGVARELQVVPELALHFSDRFDDECDAMRMEIETIAAAGVKRIWLFGTTHHVSNDGLLGHAGAMLRRSLSGVRIGGGSASHFVELNRYPFNFQLVDDVVYAVTPLAHAIDDRTMIENLATQPHALRSAKQLAPGKPISVSPVTLRGRGMTDDRQSTLMAAGWMLASIKYLAEEGVSSISFFETHGPRGFVNGDAPFPVADALRRLRSFSPDAVIQSTSSKPLVVSSLVLEKGSRVLTVLINHSAETVRCTVEGNHYSLEAYHTIYIEG